MEWKQTSMREWVTPNIMILIIILHLKLETNGGDEEWSLGQ